MSDGEASALSPLWLRRCFNVMVAGLRDLAVFDHRCERPLIGFARSTKESLFLASAREKNRSLTER